MTLWFPYLLWWWQSDTPGWQNIYLHEGFIQPVVLNKVPIKQSQWLHGTAPVPHPSVTLIFFTNCLQSKLDMFLKLFALNWLLHNQMHLLTICVFSISETSKMKVQLYEYIWPCLTVFAGYMADLNSLEIFHWQRLLFVWTYNLKNHTDFSNVFTFHWAAGFSWGMLY